MSKKTNMISFDLKRCKCEVTVELYNYPFIKDASAFVRVNTFYINPMTGEQEDFYVDSKYITFSNLELEERRHEIFQSIIDACGGYLSIAMKQRLLKKICSVIAK